MANIDPINKSLCLAVICEENYLKLLRLIPDLFNLQEDLIGTAKERLAIHITLIERGPYTLTVELNHQFSEDLDALLLPAIKIRIYIDAKSAEVLSDHARGDVQHVIKDPSQSVAIMNYKWRLNYFLNKWLDHCLSVNYEFKSEHLAFV